jgi:hypothetical protein
VGIRSRWPALAVGEHNDVVGFVIIVTWENVTSAESIVGREANTLRGIYRESAAPPEVQEEIHGLVRQYAGEVVTGERPMMADAEPGSPAWATSSTS